MKFFIHTLVSLVVFLSSFSASSETIAPSVNRAIITTAIADREPVDNYNEQTLPSGTNKVFFFTEVMNQADSNVTHRWFLNGKLEAEVKLNIGSNRWRTRSSKNLDANFHSGSWEVMVVAADGTILTTETFLFEP
ncbi:DUF2914 domain-containing protein [Psychrosphaera sp. B3R10]|uniref:DUF2914 domain-containing protein n=1 Tax=Psychrosphaera algicola TaxID=3023714 RepID=A0ABT5FFJ9_9GAMM|nr:MULTISPECIES: DUF2914 domain-containing protein [unclassified Psychrosphaera]MBU2883137.1 DUF2914 domain-containing protein [Psychrosphaera sp. I2R16]MBU2988593.1 DUF2914 domain-containing protein [Psychrosphaera sp. B3R10]MDC2890324.1 DUF2914 domain-containing protein [Psychrosphaera sp. G1-22]MDO6719656.1 DUF2914 domain-containing protein [Psychrosphaera sp. 1_MG-2023]